MNKLIFLFLIILLYIILYKKEDFKQNDELSIVYYDNKSLISIFKLFLNLKENFIYNYSDNQVFKDVSNHKYDLGLMDEISFFNIYKYSNVKYVTTLNNQILTFIAHQDLNISDTTKLNNRKIGIIQDYNILNLYLKYTNKINEIVIFNNVNDLIYNFKKRKIDVIFIIIIHPSKEILELENINFIDCSPDFKNNTLYYFLPFLRKEYIENKIPSFSIRLLIISNNKTNKWKIYNFLYNIYINLNFLNYKSEYNFENTMNINNMSYISDPSIYHPGALLFYKSIGRIIIEIKK